MAGRFQLRRGNTAQNDAFIGAEGEVTYDTQAKGIRVHDGVTQGGNALFSIVAFQHPTAENNYTWYRKYSDGWVEQGGYMAGSSATVYTVNLPITMADTNYTVMATLRSNTVSGGGGSWANANAYSTTQIQIVEDYKDTWVGQGSYWTVSGMAA